MVFNLFELGRNRPFAVQWQEFELQCLISLFLHHSNDILQSFLGNDLENVKCDEVVFVEVRRSFRRL